MTGLDRALTEYRLRTVRIGVWTTVFVLLALLLSVVVPGEDDTNRGAMLALMAVALVGAGLVSALPWRRLFERGLGLPSMYTWSVLDVVLITLLIANAGRSHMEVFFLYGFTTLFAASYPYRAQVALLAFTSASYLGVMALQGWPVEGPEMVARVGLLAVLAWMASFLSRELIGGLIASADARRESEERARLLGVVADAARTVTALDSEEVLEAVVTAATRLGFEAASLAVYDEDAGIFRVPYAVGLPEEYTSAEHPIDLGIAGLVRERRRTSLLADYANHPRAIAAVAREGFQAVAGTPVWARGTLHGALLAGTRPGRPVTDQDVEALELLGAVAGQVFDNARRFEDQRRSNERLAELDRLKSDFLSNVSHELRTPLTAIKGMGATLEQLWNEIAEGDRRDLLARLNANAVSLNQIITTLLDFSQLEAGRLRLQPQDVDVVSLLHGLLARLGNVLSTHPVRLDAPERLVVRADAVLLDRVLENLVSNATKHTPPGTEVVVTVEEAAGRALVSVADRGPGISEEELPHIAERFFRGGDPNARRTRGTGLGLALVEEILRLHDSDLEVESRVGHGSRFSFRLSAVVREDEDVLTP